MDSELKVVISASRRSDLVAHFPQWLAEALSQEKATLIFPRRNKREISLEPEKVHTLVLCPKIFIIS